MENDCVICPKTDCEGVVLINVDFGNETKDFVCQKCYDTRKGLTDCQCGKVFVSDGSDCCPSCTSKNEGIDTIADSEQELDSMNKHHWS